MIHFSVKHSSTTNNPIDPEQAKAFRRRLLAWYRKHRRDLPWRTSQDELPNAYHTLVSEAMLQQTQVATVVPYFHRFIDAFPTVHSLAEAQEQAVLTLWQGLGYYRRARHLHAAAKAIVADYDGEVPASVEELLKLPGVGRYTAGAIASIAHGTRAAVVDGNVERVFARLMLIEDPINTPATKQRLWDIAEELVPRLNPGDYNQALMELGAMVCTPKLPKCFVCPVRESCRAVRETNPERLPVKLTKKKAKEVTHVVFAAERRGRFLFEQRPSEGLWSNMWQLPTWEEPTAAPTDFKALADWFRDRFGLTLGSLQPATEFVHQTTHRTIRFVMLRAPVVSGRLKRRSGLWRDANDIGDLPLSNPQRVIAEHLNSEDKS
jgi:A/G-specific adenine glycosylase